MRSTLWTSSFYKRSIDNSRAGTPRSEADDHCPHHPVALPTHGSAKISTLPTRVLTLSVNSVAAPPVSTKTNAAGTTTIDVRAARQAPDRGSGGPTGEDGFEIGPQGIGGGLRHVDRGFDLALMERP